MVRRGDDSGQAIGLVLMSIGLVAMVMLGVLGVSVRLIDRSRAQNAADAAALAGVSGGADEATEAAQRNGAALVSFEQVPGARGTTVTVEVAIGDEHAVARASDEP